MEAVKITGLTKYYGSKAAVADLNMTVPEGSIYGFIGRNGAGKSTTLKMLCGLAKKDSGDISVYGKSITHEPSAGRIGILIEDAGLYPGFCAYDNLKMKALCTGILHAEKRIAEMLSLVGLEHAGKKVVRQFSMGMKQRLGVAMAMLGSPDMLILDEPINGLDPEGIREIRELLLHFNRDSHMTILLSSHILSELGKIATNYGIIKDGTMVKEITAAELVSQCQDYLSLRTLQEREACTVLEETLNLRNYRVYPEGEIRIYEASDILPISRAFAEAGVILTQITPHRQDLEQYFFDLMEGGLKHV